MPGTDRVLVIRTNSVSTPMISNVSKGSMAHNLLLACWTTTHSDHVRRDPFQGLVANSGLRNREAAMSFKGISKPQPIAAE